MNPNSSNRQQATNNRLFHRNNGFTLIELIVVIALIGLMLFFSLPRLQHNPFLDDSNKSARWLIGKIQALKESAIRDQKQYALHIDLDSGRPRRMPPDFVQRYQPLAATRAALARQPEPFRPGVEPER